MKTAANLLLAALLVLATVGTMAQDEPRLVPDVVDYQKLIPILPKAPEGWTADDPEGSTEDVGGFRITNVHRDYRKGEGDKAPTAAISILDSVSNPDYVTATSASWNRNTETPDGYSKSVTIDGHPGFEAFDSPRELKSLQDERQKLVAAGSKDPAALAAVDRRIHEAELNMHSTLWVMIANRYFVQIELTGEHPPKLQEWIKRIDLKKLAAIK